jgi:Spy/CpxP family protein refolding chaperone
MSTIKLVISIAFIVIGITFINAQTADKKDVDNKKENVNKNPQFKNGMRHSMEGHKKFLREKLHLTDQQVTKIESLRSEHMKKMIDMKGDLKKIMIDQKSIRNKESFTREDIIAGVEKANKIKNEIALANANHRMDIWETLTPEQKKIVKDNPQWLMGDRHQMMHKRFEGKNHPMMHKGSDGKRPMMDKKDNDNK